MHTVAGVLIGASAHFLLYHSELVGPAGGLLDPLVTAQSAKGAGPTLHLLPSLRGRGFWERFPRPFTCYHHSRAGGSSVADVGVPRLLLRCPTQTTGRGQVSRKSPT